MLSSQALPCDLPGGWEFVTHSTIDSTNAEIMRRAQSGAAEGLAIQADSQTAGRGRRGRAWASPVGNLYMSVLLDAPVATAGQVGFAAALALIDGLEAEAGMPLPDLKCKWPNDLLLSGNKVAGLLLEAVPERDQVIVGLGANLVPTEVADTLYPVGSLAESGVDMNARLLAAQVCCALASWLESWRNVGFDVLRKAWLNRAHGLHDPITVRLPQETLEGRFGGLSADGALVLAQSEGERIIAAGDVFFAPPHAQYGRD